VVVQTIHRATETRFLQLIFGACGNNRMFNLKACSLRRYSELLGH